MITGIINKIKNNDSLSKSDALQLLNIQNDSSDLNEIINLSNELTRSLYNNNGYVFAQIGLNAEPCSMNCKFCSMAASHYSLETTWKKDLPTILNEVNEIINHKISDLFLMITADYDIDEFITIVKEVRSILPPSIRLVGNLGDFDYQTAQKLKNAGLSGIYHIHRLREGVDTDIPSENRIITLNAIKEAELELYYCIEPIGPEHSYEEIVEEMFRASEYNVQAMAVMRRTPVQGTPLYEYGEISDDEFTKIAAVTRLVTKPGRSMNAHETLECTLNAGVNQLYAEIGSNPRDTESNTIRGWSVSKTADLLERYNFIV